MHGQYYNNLYFEYMVDLNKPFYHGSPYLFEWPNKNRELWTVEDKKVARWYAVNADITVDGAYIYEVRVKPSARILDYSNPLVRSSIRNVAYKSGMDAMNNADPNSKAGKLTEAKKREIIRTAADLCSVDGNWYHGPELGSGSMYSDYMNFVDEIESKYDISLYSIMGKAVEKEESSYDAWYAAFDFGSIASYKNKEFTSRNDGQMYMTLVIENMSIITSFKLVETTRKVDEKALYDAVEKEGEDIDDFNRTYG